MFKGLVLLCLLIFVCAVHGQTSKKAAAVEDNAETTPAAPPDDLKKNRELPTGNENSKDNEKKYESGEGYRFQRGEKEINFEFGIAPFRPTHFAGPEEYDTDNRKLGLTTFRWGRVIGTKKTITYQYLFEISPLVYCYRNEVRNPDYISPEETPDKPPTIRKNTYGTAITPVAFRFYFFSKSRFKPFAQFGAGMLFTNHKMPLPAASWYNFTGYFGGGGLYHLTRKTTVSVAYRYFHISNFNTTDFNPGYNANTFSVGYSYFFK